MESRNAHVRSSFWRSLSLSLLLHTTVLFTGFSSSDQPSGPAKSTGAPPRLQATLASSTPLRAATVSPTRRPPAAVMVAAKKSVIRSEKLPDQRTVPKGTWTTPTWSAAERTDMNKFLNELAEEARPPRGNELAEKARLAARQMRTGPQDDGEDQTVLSATNGKGVEPYSLEMYFDAFVRKMNRSAAFVSNDKGRRPGSLKALVEIALNADGSLKSYRVLRSGDQATEIAYIKSVIDRASPFSAFPSDIRRASESLTILMCILPAHTGGGGGFSRSFGPQDCRD